MLSGPHRATTLALTTLVTLVAFEALATATAMPVAARELGGVRSYGLVFSLFLTTSLLGIVAAGGWSDARGPRGPMLAGLTLFAGGLVLSGTASSFGVLLAGRAVSGLGGGLLTVSIYVVVAGAYPEALRPRVFGVLSSAWVLPSVLGPPVAGWLATQVSWRAVFLVAVPLTAVPVPALLRRLRPGGRAGPGGAGDADLVSGRLVRGLALAVGAVAVQWGLQGAGGLPAPPVVVAGAVLVVAALPGLLPAGALRLARGLPSVVVVRGLFTAAFFGAETFVPLMLVTERDLSPALAGLTLTAGAVGWSAGSWLQSAGRLPVGRPTLLWVGGLVIGVSVLLLAVTPFGGVPPWLVAPMWSLGGLGMGLGMSSTSVLTLDLSEPGAQGRNSAGLQVSDALGGVLGIGVAGAVFAVLHDPGGSDAGTFALIWLVLGVVGLASAPVALRVRRPAVQQA